MPILAFRFLINMLFGVSILHLLLTSGERFLAIKHPFAHTSLVKESNLLIASSLAWLLPSVVNVYFFLAENMIAFVLVDNSIILTSVACIGYCHFKVYFETRRHKRQIADQQVSQETRKKLLKDHRAFKVTSLTIAMMLLCSLPTTLVRLVTTMFPSTIIGTETWAFLVSYDDEFVKHLFRGTQRQFSENICSEDDLRSRIFGTFCVKFLAYLPLLGFSNI